MSAKRERPTAACVGRSWLFLSIDREDHAAARRSCVDNDGRPICPAFQACEATARDLFASDYRSGIHGTWAGVLYSPGAKKWERVKAKRNAGRRATRKAARS